MIVLLEKFNLKYIPAYAKIIFGRYPRKDWNVSIGKKLSLFRLFEVLCFFFK